MKIIHYIKILAWPIPLFLLISCSDSRDQRSEIIRPVRSQEVFLSGGTQIRSFAGVSKAGLETNLSFKVAGTIKQIHVKVGDQVKAGQLIARLDATDYNLQLDQMEASLTQAEVQMQNAKSNYDRVSILYENGNTSVNDYEQAKAAYESARANANSARKQVELAEQRVRYTQLLVPIPGRVANVYAEKNENIMAGFTMVTISSGTDIEVTVGMPESFIAMVNESDTVEVEFSSLPEKSFSGMISEVSYTPGLESSTYPVTIKLQDPSEDIRPGMTANVMFRLASGSREEVILVPPVAVGQDNDGNFVYVVERIKGDTAIVHRRSVTVGNITGDGFEIINGLQDGERVVTAGISKLTEGLKVKIVQ